MTTATTPDATDTLSLIPDPREVHERLCELTRQSAILRRQLRLSLAAKREREERMETAGAGGRELVTTR